MQSIRNKVQKEATQAIIQNKFNGIIYVSPRVGKSKIVVDAIKKLKSKKILITAPYNTILDSWTTEFEKWDVSTINITLINQRSLSKVNIEEYHYIICDEVHTLSEAQTEILKDASHILGLTGSLSRDSMKYLNQELNLKPIYTFSVEEAIEAGIVADYMIYLIPVTLDNKDKYIEAGTAKQKFMTTEYANYQYLTSQFDKFKRMAWNNKKFDAVKMQFASKRASMLYNAKSKIAAAKKVIEKHERCLIFTARTEVADSFAKSYHSKSTEDTLEQFKNGEIDKLAVCEMTNMGITIPNLKVGIFLSLMEINQEIVKFLKEHSIDCSYGLLYLLGVYHNLDGVSEIIPEPIIRAINALGIVERNYKDNTIEWHIPLYDGQNVDSVWEWVNEYRELFASKNKERSGSKKTCVLRMKLFFQQNPHIRKQDVLEATRNYLRTVEPKFVKTAERFIYDGQGNYKTSLLSTWVERLIETKNQAKNDPNIKMMK